LAPSAVIALTERVPEPELVMVRGRVLVAPTWMDGKLNEVGEKVMAGAAPPVTVTVTMLDVEEG
jgi:hypothetical protein